MVSLRAQFGLPDEEWREVDFKDTTLISSQAFSAKMVDYLFRTTTDGDMKRFDSLSMISISNILERAKVNMLSLAVPLLYNRWFDKSHRYGVSLGPVVNFNLAGGLYNHYEIADNAYDINTSHIGHRPVTIDIMAKFNTPIFDFYIKFSPMSLFKSDRGPEFSYITIGMSL
jgi:hypothetical protein